MALFKPAKWNGALPPADIAPAWQERFNASVFIFFRQNRHRECWIWTGPFDGSGYGMFSFNRQSAGGGRTAAVRAHRFALEQFIGCTLQPELVVLHGCDTPQCVNPLHLRVGTIQCNMDDRNAKGRQARGETNSHAKLTEIDVIAIRASSEDWQALARRYGVTRPTIYNIKARRIWRHI